jgi:hypothetical protein
MRVELRDKLVMPPHYREERELEARILREAQDFYLDIFGRNEAEDIENKARRKPVSH